jgi:exosortase
MAFLLAVPYSYGVGTDMFSLGEYLWINWTTNEDMQQGFLVAPAFAYLVYQKRQALVELNAGGLSVVGLACLAGGLFLFWAGSQADVTSIGLGSLMITVAGLVWFLLGWDGVRTLAFPLAFLIFAIPIPGVDFLVAFPLRVLMSNISAAVLNLIGVAVVQSGTGILSAPDAQLGLAAGQKFSVDVADPCSGIRSLFALMMVSALYAHFTLKTLWQKWVLFLCSIPLAVLGNLFRILMLTFGIIAMGPEKAIGTLERPSFFHMMAGYLVFVVALAGMIGIGALLQLQWSTLRDRWSDLRRPPPPRTERPSGRTQTEDLY